MRKILKLILFMIITLLMLINNSIAVVEENGRIQTNTNSSISMQTITDGIYIIKTVINTNYVLDVSNGSVSEGANIQLWSDSEVAQQRFKVEYIDEGYYKITSIKSNKVLDVANGNKNSGTNVQQYTWNNTDAQKWIIKETEEGYYNIISKCNGLNLDVSSGIAKNGANIQLYTANGTTAQKFMFEKYKEPEPIRGTQTIEDGTYIIKTAINTNYVLDVSDGAISEGANIQIWTDMIVLQQRFKVEYIDEGYYKITSIKSNKVLDVANGSKNSGTNVQQYIWNNTDAQKWIIKETEEGCYNIISKCNGLNLDVSSGIAKNGANIQLYTANGTTAQKFMFEKYKEPEPIRGTQTIEDGTYIIKTVINTNYVLDVSDGAISEGANIQLWSDAEVSQQRFKVVYIGEGYYKITSVKSNKVLDVANGSEALGTNVQQYTWNNTDAQKWIIKETEEGCYNIISKCNGLNLDVSSGIAKNGANVQMYKKNNTNAQQFIFEEVKNTVSMDTAKYPGYQEKINELAEKHPNWTFELLYTGLRYNDVIAGETALHSRNLVPTTYGGEWICSTCGTRLYDSGWYCASSKAVAYYMDPRNFLDETNVFQFVDVNQYTSDFTNSAIQTQVNGTYLENYTNDISNACRNKGVNPFYIISRLIQEQGRNGTTIGKGMDGGDGKTYYNPFDIGASGNGYSEIYANALARAKREGWDTMEKALEGGIVFCKSNWLDNYQNTLYQNKFDIDTRNGSALYNHQYMQNLMGAYSEAVLLRGMYDKSNIVDSNITFIIPVYEEMSSSNYPEPTNNTETYPMDVETTGTYVRIRAEANTNSEILRELPNKGTRLLSLQRGINSNWQKVITTDGLIGYISGDYVRQINDITTCNYSAIVKTNDGDGCNVRVGPSTRADRITGLADYTQVTVIDNSTYRNIDGFDWCRIIIPNGLQAFIPSRYLK